MLRPKGSKNKAPRKATIPTTDFTSLIAEKASTKEALVTDIASLEENLTALKADLKAELEEMIQKLMADGVSAAEILEKLK